MSVLVRIWRCPVSALDRQHLLGEHLETHIVFGAILNKRKSIKSGWQNHPQTLRFDSDAGLGKLAERHHQQVQEMEKRGYRHKSPLPDVASLRRQGYSLGDGYNSVEMEKDILTLILRKKKWR